MRIMVRLIVAVMVLTMVAVTYFAQPALASNTSKLDRAVDKMLKKLYAKSPAAVELSKVAKGVLVFPSITTAGLILGGHYGEGALRVDGKTVGYYNTIAGSLGLQAGAQKFGYALFFMDTPSLEYLKKSDGWEIGIGPSVVFVDEGMAKSISSTTTREGIYAFIFNQQGLMAGIGIQGSKISKIKP